MILKDKKVDYPENGNIKTFPYIDWISFIIYNIKDSLLPFGIETKVNDVMVYYMRSQANLTSFSKIFRETTLLRNVRELYFERDEGLVQSNNLNIIDEKSNDDEFYGKSETDDEELTYDGAIVGDPLMNDYVGLKIMGLRSNNVFKLLMDFDMGAFYPSTKIICNMDASTLLYKASFDNDEFISGEYSNKSLNQVYEKKDKNGNIKRVDITGEAVNTYMSGNILTFGYNYLNTPSISKIYELVKERLTI